MSNIKIDKLLERSGFGDKDERYMAISDLCVELAKEEVKIDANLEIKICTAIFNRLQVESMNDVQSIAVKCLSILVGREGVTQVSNICKELANHILTGKPELRDMYASGLKILIKDVPIRFGNELATSLVADKSKTNILMGVRNNVAEVKSDCFDILHDLLTRFGSQMASEHEKIMNDCLTHLTHDQPQIRKRASLCTSTLALTLNDNLLKSLVVSLTNKLKEFKKLKGVPGGKDVTVIQTVGGISRNVGFRLGPYLRDILPLFLEYCAFSGEEDDDDDDKRSQLNEVRENCLYAIESFVIRCPAEVDTKIEEIVALMLKFCKYDPNYNDDGEDEDEENGDDDDEDGFSDDDDNSWKVRRGAVKVLTAAITYCPKKLRFFYEECSKKLIARFSEREESVRIEVINCYTALLKATVVEIENENASFSSNVIMPPKLMKMRSSGDVMESFMPELIKATKLQLKGKSIKSKTALFIMLKQCSVIWKIGKVLTPDWFDAILPATIEAILNKKSDGALKLEALQFLNRLLQSHPYNVTGKFSYLSKHFESLSSALTQISKESWYKITTELLNVVGTFIHQIRPYDEVSDCLIEIVNYRKFIAPLYDVVFPCLEGLDIDQEVKESSIYAAGELIAYFGPDIETKKFSALLPLFLNRLRNEITRVPSMRAFISIASSSLSIDMNLILGEVVAELASFLRQNSRSLKQDALETLIAMIKKYGKDFSNENIESMIKESANLLTDSDLHIANLVLQLSAASCSVIPKSSSSIIKFILPSMLSLSNSPLLQTGSTLDSLLNLYSMLTTNGYCPSDDIINKLLEPTAKRGEMPRLTALNIARCIATVALTKKDVNSSVDSFLGQLKKAEGSFQQVLLLCLGEIGKKYDLTRTRGIYEVIMEAFKSGSEDAKSAGAHAFGNIAVGNINDYLPVILNELKNDDKKYLILSALKVVISHGCVERSGWSKRTEVILQTLLKEMESKEEGVRNMIAECLGKLTIIDSAFVLPKLVELIKGSDHSKWTVVTSLKYTLDDNHEAPTGFDTVFGNFMDLLLDPKLEVRRAALQTLNSIAYHRIEIVKPLLATTDLVLFKHLFGEMRVKPELIYKKNLGPFTQTVDDGLVLRKAAFACMLTFIEMYPQMDGNVIALLIQPAELSEAKIDGPLIQGLDSDNNKENTDVEMLCQQVLLKLARNPTFSKYVLNSIKSIVTVLQKNLAARVSEINKQTSNKEGSDISIMERAKDSIRGTLRVMDVIKDIPEAKSLPSVTDFFEGINKTDILRNMYQSFSTEK